MPVTSNMEYEEWVARYLADLQKKAKAYDFLLFFYQKVNDIIKEQYQKETGNKIPEGF